MTKAEMIQNLDDVLTDRGLRRELVERALETTSVEPVAISGRYTAIASEGSSGERGIFVFGEAAWVGFVLSLTRPLVARLRTAGAPRGLPLAMVAAPSSVHATGCAAAWSAGCGMPLQLISVPATLPLGEIVERLNILCLSGLVGYPTMLARLAIEQGAARLSSTRRTAPSRQGPRVTGSL